jgi:hypothetical protein
VESVTDRGGSTYRSTVTTQDCLSLQLKVSDVPFSLFPKRVVMKANWDVKVLYKQEA